MKSTEILQAYNTHGIQLALKGMFPAAEVAFLRALNALDDPGVRANYANVLRRLWRFDEASEQVALANPEEDFTRYIKGSIAYETGHSFEAIQHLESVQEIDAQHQFCRAMAYLQNGRWADGFREYESRNEINKPPAPGIKPWTGEIGTVLVHHEQGYGDSLMMSRFVTDQIFSVPSPLYRLFKEGTNLNIVSMNNHTPKADYIAPLMSLPHILGVDHIAPPKPYIRTPGEHPVPQPPGTKLKVGLVWTAKAQAQPMAREESLHGHQKSIPLELLLPLGAIPGVGLYGLQTGEASKDIAKLGAENLVMNLGNAILDFADLAGFMASMDLIVTVDTAPLHLAGAMGKPAIGLLCYPGSWQWMESDKTPWYESITLVRQPKPFDWESAVAKVYTLIEQM